MTLEKVACDECGRVKAEANHWHRVGVILGPANEVSLELGHLFGEVPAGNWIYDVHDLCGEQCLHKHIAKLLGFNEPPLFAAPVEESAPTRRVAEPA